MEPSYRSNPPRSPLPYILLAGGLIGAAISVIFFLAPPSKAQDSPTGTPSERPAALSALTPTIAQYQAITPIRPAQPFAREGNPAPDFRLKTLDGKDVHLSDFHGKPVLINVWATWCPPCRLEMPGIQAAYEKYQEEGLVVLGIDLTVQDNLPDVPVFVRDLKLTFPILLDESGDVSARLYGLRGLPTSYFIDRNGTLRHIQIGEMTPGQLDENLAAILPQ